MSAVSEAPALVWWRILYTGVLIGAAAILLVVLLARRTLRRLAAEST